MFEVQSFASITRTRPSCGSILPPRPFLCISIVIHSPRGVYAIIEIEVVELGIGEDGKVVFDVVALLLLCRKVVCGGDGVEVGDVLRDVGCPSRAVS